MPVSTSVCNMEAALEAAVLSQQHGISYFKNIESCLEGLKANSQGQAQVCGVEMMRKLITVVQEHLPCQRFWQVEVMVLVVKFMSAFPEQEQSEGLAVFIDNGLFEILVFVFDETRKHISPASSGSTASCEADHLMEILLETINDVAECGDEARKQAVDSFGTRLIKLVVEINKCFHTRMEAERTLNLLLEGCEDDVIELAIGNPLTQRLLQYLAEYLPVAGDFEMQIAITESLARLVKKSERKKYCAAWFKSDSTSKAFLNIQDQQFDSDCRKFLNLLNASGPDSSVWSFSCLKAYMGDFELKSPHDDNLNEFWVDFNSASKSITMYVADEESQTEEEGGLWETVCFRCDKIKEYFITEERDGCTRLDLSLTEPASSFLPCCGSDMDTAYIIFEPMTDLTEALSISMGAEKNATLSEVPSSTRRSSVSKINVLINRSKNTSWGLSNMPQSFHNGYVDQENNGIQAESEAKHSHTNGKKTTQARRKSSIPLVPMSSPTRTSLYPSTASDVSSTSEAQHSKPVNQGFTQPKTPTGPHGSTKKVKTPLQITVADKPNTSASDDSAKHSTAKAVSSRKVSVSAVAVCPSPRYQTTKEQGAQVGKKSIIALPEASERPRSRLLATDEKQNEVREIGSTGQPNKTVNPQTEKGASKTSKDSSKQKTSKDSSNQKSDKANSSGDDGEGKLDRSTRNNQKEMAKEGVDKPATSDAFQQSQEEITRIPDTQSQTLASQISVESEKSLEVVIPQKGKKKGRKTKENKPVPEVVRRSTRNSANQKSDKAKSELSTLPNPLVPDRKTRRGQKVKLYSDTSVLMADTPSEKSESEVEDKKEASKSSRGRGKKSGKAETKDSEESESAPHDKEAKHSRGNKKSVKQQDVKSKAKKTSKKAGNGHDDQPSEKDDEILQKQGKGSEKIQKTKKTKEKAVAMSVVNNHPLAKKITSDGNPTKQLNSDLMIQPDPSERETALKLPKVNERDAALALAAENADFVIPSSVPEERYGNIIPDSQPNYRADCSLRRSGRFPSPLLSDITEESALSKSTQSKGSLDLRQRALSKSSNMSQELEESIQAPVIKSILKPQAAKADSTSQLILEKDPYDFVDSSTVSSLSPKGNKGRRVGSAGDTVGTRRTRRSYVEQEQEEDVESGNASQELDMVGNSQDDFVSHSHKFGPACKESVKEKQQKKGKSGRRRSSRTDEREIELGGGDGSKAKGDKKEEEVEVTRGDRKCPTPSRKRMKGKLDSDVEYIQRIENEASKTAEFMKRMEELDADEFPDVEVVRDVALATDAYHDRSINEFVSSVMKSLPKHRADKGFVKKEKSVVGKVSKRRDMDDVQMQIKDRGDVEDRSEPDVNIDADVIEEEPKIDGDTRKVKKGKAKQITKKHSESKVQQKPEEQLEEESRKNISNESILVHHERSMKKSSSRKNEEQEKYSRKREVPSQKKVIKPASSTTKRDEESLTEGEMSMDDLLSAHMNSILGNSKKDSHSKASQLNRSEEQRDKDGSHVAMYRRGPGEMDVDDSQGYEFNEVILKQAEASISRRSRMIAALEYSSATQSDGEEEDTSAARRKPQKQELSKKKKGEKSMAAHAHVDDIKSTKRDLQRASLKKQEQDIEQEEVDYQHETDGTEVEMETDEELEDQISAKKPSKSKKGIENVEKKAKARSNPVCSQRKRGKVIEQEEEDYEHETEDIAVEEETDEEFEEKISAKKPSKMKTGTENVKNQTKRFRSKQASAQESAPKEVTETGKKTNRQSSDRVRAKSAQSPADQMKHSDCPPKMTPTTQESRSHFGSQIMDSDTEEVDSHIPSLTAPDDTATVVSVESFSSMCKNLLNSSRTGSAAGRKRRKLCKVDYTEQETESESSLETSLHTPVVPSKKSSKHTTKDVYEYTEESSLGMASSVVDDALSERSWLNEKPKQKVSTYSKTRTEVLGFGKISKNLETVKKAKRTKPKETILKAPKKRKSQEPVEQEEEFSFYYFQDDVNEKKKSKKQKKQPSAGQVGGGGDASFETTMLTVPKMQGAGCRRSLLERIASTSAISQSTWSASQDLMDDGEGSERCKDAGEEEEEEQEERIPTTPALTIETLTSQMSVWTTPGSVTRTPKQVSFLDEEEFEDDESEGQEDPVQLNYPVSGPSKLKRPTESALKRKYPKLIDDDDDEDTDDGDNDHEAIDEDDDDKENEEARSSGLNLSSKYNSLLQPKKLFQAGDNVADGQAGSDKSGETGESISDHSVTSSWGQNLDFPTMQLPEMFGLLTNRMKQKMTMKKNHTQALTETAIQSTQKQMNKLFMQLHKARQKGQEEFQHKLLTELVEMEQSLEKLSQIQAQNEQVLKQFKRKSTDHVEQHVKNVQKLHASFLKRSSSLGEDVVEMLESVLHKEMKSMQQKLMKDMQQQQFQKTVQSLFFLR